ncbi:MAG TPA: hypothetical protein VEU11_11605, partial [Terriglobales bacterium]|nr:hypothetical protein [Terriglobales bacterium]
MLSAYQGFERRVATFYDLTGVPGQAAWEYLQLGGLAEGRLPDADEVVNLTEKAGVEVSRTEINRLLERLLAETVTVGGVEYHLAFGSGSTKDRRFMFSTHQNLSWLEQLFQTAENAFAYGGVFTSQASNLVRIPNAESGRLHVKVVEPGTLVAPDNMLVSAELARELGTSIAQGRLLLLKDGLPVALAKGQFVEAVDDEVLAELKVDLIISSDCIKAGAFPEDGPIDDALFVLLNEPEEGMTMKLGYHVVMNLNDEELEPIMEHGRQEMAKVNEAVDSGNILPLVGEELTPE